MIRSAAVLTLALAPAAGAFELALPVECALGANCFIQQAMDRDPGPGATDFACGTLSYDGHSGTDFALPDLAAMAAGVRVLAAAPGVVRAVRDGMQDIAVTDPAAPPLQGRDCGNGLAIDHGDGWETQYCHMRRDSLLVTPGQTVKAGTPLGLVGLSGNTEFPHLHLSLRRKGVDIDPFDPDGALRCGDSGPALWNPPLPVPPGGLVAIGISDAVPEFAGIKAGLPARPDMPAGAPALVVWAHYFGNRAGDDLRLMISGPDGVVIDETLILERTQARAFRAIGKRLRDGGRWPAGQYSAMAVLLRAGAEIGRADLTFVIR